VETGRAPTPFYRNWRYIIPVAVLVVLLLVSLFVAVPSAPKNSYQIALDRAIDYFHNNYSSTTGLIPESPGSSTYWLNSDNYLSTLAVSRYDPSNSSTAGFGSALHAALVGYVVTLPPALTQNQYEALNSTSAYFRCSANYMLGWSTGNQSFQGHGPVLLMTTANDLSPACASQNYADLLFLQALYYHRIGNLSAASNLYQSGVKDFDGFGFADVAYSNSSSTSYHLYQTYKVALFVYTTSCLGLQSSSQDIGKATSILMSMQSDSTGGFATSYQPNLTSLNAPQVTPGQGVNTETTALAALALELVIHPLGSC